MVAAAASGPRGMAPRRGRRTDRANETGARRRSRRRPDFRDRDNEWTGDFLLIWAAYVWSWPSEAGALDLARADYTVLSGETERL